MPKVRRGSFMPAQGERLTAIDLFAGAGGLSEGLVKAGIVTGAGRRGLVIEQPEHPASFEPMYEQVVVAHRNVVARRHIESPPH